MKSDVKGVYKKNIGKTDIVGLGQRFDEPVNCDLYINVDKMSIKDSFYLIIKYIAKKYGDKYDE